MSSLKKKGERNSTGNYRASGSDDVMIIIHFLVNRQQRVLVNDTSSDSHGPPHSKAVLSASVYHAYQKLSQYHKGQYLIKLFYITLLSLFSEPVDNYCIALDEFHTWYTNILERNVSKIQRDCFCPKTIILHKEVETFDTLQYLGTIRQETSLGYQHSTYCEEGSTVPLPSLEV